MKLFAVYLGGKAQGANIEVHDLVFAVGEDIKSCFPELRKKWFGDPNSVHIDSYGEINLVKGYQVELTPKSLNSKTKEKLFFVNLGFAETKTFGEGHLMDFLVAPSALSAKALAKSLFPPDTIGHHIDNLIKIDQVDSWQVNLHATKEEGSFQFKNVYWKL